MWMPFIFLGIGLLLIFSEFFLPGGIMGIAGGVLLVLSIVFFAIQSDSLVAVIIFTVVSIVLFGVLVKFALWRIKRGKGGKGLYLDTAQEGYVASKFDGTLIGKRGSALSDLKPAGHVLIEGRRYQAVSKLGYVLKGTSVEVIGGEGAHIIVKPISEEKKS